MTEDCRINLYYPVTTIIYVFLHTTISVQVFRSNRTLTEDSSEEDKLWSLRKWLEWNCNWRNIFYQFRFRPTPIFMIDISKVKRGWFLENRKIWKGVYFSRFLEGIIGTKFDGSYYLNKLGMNKMYLLCGSLCRSHFIISSNFYLSRVVGRW